VVIGRGVEEGQTVAASLQAPTLFEIAQDLAQMEVHVSVDEADIGQIEIGQAITFTVDAYPAQVFTGSVTEIRKSPAVINNVVSYTVVVSSENPDLLLLPGMTATVRMVVMEVSNAIRIPNAALRFRPPGASATAPGAVDATSHTADSSDGRPAIVWVSGLLGDSSPIEIRVGASDGSATELLSGELDVGDTVVVGMRRSADKPALFGIRLGS
jgi:HlyD family secretion protein